MATFTITTAVNGDSLVKLGSVAGLAWTHATTTATVTQNAHGMLVGDFFYVTATTDASCIVTGLKTLTAVTTNTFSFVCLNAGTTGTVTGHALDEYLINGGYLTIDQHSRYGLNQTTSSAMYDIPLSSSLGGTIEFNSTKVRLIPYNTGTGNVPTISSTITQGSASGKLLGVYSALNVAPTTAGSAMPASGYILIRQWNDVAFTASALTGISATATAADGPGWLEIVGFDLGTVTVNRLNLFKVRGDYYDFLGVTTSGSRATTYQIPSNGSLVYCPGVEVETGTGTGVYEFYHFSVVTALVANIATDAVRGRMCWISTAGLLRFGHDGTNSTGGYIPPAGRKIRVRNIFFTCCTQLAPTANVIPNATLASRYEFATNGGGAIDIDKASINWYCNFVQPFSVALTNTQVMDTVVLSECVSAIAWSNVSVSPCGSIAIQGTFSIAYCLSGGTMTDCSVALSGQSNGNYPLGFADSSNFTFTNLRLHALTKSTNTSSGSMTLTRATASQFINTLLGAGRAMMTTCADIDFDDTVYYDHPALTTSSTIPMVVWELYTASTRIVCDGLSFGGLTMVQPYTIIMQIQAAGCSDIYLRNIGTAAAPLEMGGALRHATWTRSGTTISITSTAHGLKIGDAISVVCSSDVAAKAISTTAATMWTVAAITDANTFTVTNAVSAQGQTTGQYLSYWPGMTGGIINVNTSAAATRVFAQRCYLKHARGFIAEDNSSKGITYDNCWADDWAARNSAGLNMTMRGLQGSHPLTAATGIYGTHLLDFFTAKLPATRTVSWTRTTAVAAITSAGHGLRVGDQIVVTTTPSAAAIVLGVKTIIQNTASATPPIPSDVFSFNCLNAGATSGSLDLTFDVLTGRVALMMNEPTAETAAQVTLSNGAAFTSLGSCYMPTIGHQLDFTSPHSIRGHSSFPIAEAVMAGGTIGNYDISYSLDGGVTYSNLYYPRAGGSGSNASTNVDMTSTTGVAVGDYVWGTNIAPNAKVTSITSGTRVVVNIANIGTVSGVLRFNHLPSETVADALVGFPLRLRIKTTTTNATAITSLYFSTQSTDAARAAQYDLDTVVTTLSANVSLVGAEIRVYDLDGSPAGSLGTELAGTESAPSSTFAFTSTSNNTVWIQVMLAGYEEFGLETTVGAAASTLSIILKAELNS